MCLIVGWLQFGINQCLQQIGVFFYFDYWYVILGQLFEVCFVQVVQVIVEQVFGNVFCCFQVFFVVDKVCYLFCQYVLGVWCFIVVFVFFFQGIDFCNVYKGEEFEEVIDISICGVNLELVEFVWIGFFWIQLYGVVFGFIEFGVVCFGDQWYGQVKYLVLMQMMGQIDVGGDVVLLVRIVDLQCYVVQFVQVGKVVILQQIVREFGKGDILIVMIQMLFYCFFVDYLVDREVFIDIVQEGQYVYVVKLVIVICCDC